MSRRFRSLVAVGAIAVAGTAAAVVATTAAHADTKICDQYGTTTIQGKYVVMNNRWGTSAEQCINVTDTGFSIVSQQGTGNTSGAPVSYPAVYLGCHYTKCSPGTSLPMQIGSIGNVSSSIEYTYVSGATYDAAYDIWLDPSAKKDGVNQTEIMIWFNRQGSIQPIGSSVGKATVGGREWDVWRGNNGSNNVISFLAPAAISSWSFNTLDFIKDAVSRGLAQNSWYLTSIQAGFEPWIGGTGLAVKSFSAVVNDGNWHATTPPVTSGTSSGSSSAGSSSTSGGSPGNGTAACSVNYKINGWAGGYVADVTIGNTGGAAVSGWSLEFSLPSGQQVANAWNATVTQSGNAVTAKSVAHNGTIASGGTASFGFQGTSSGGNAAPTGFSLNGTACSAG